MTHWRRLSIDHDHLIALVSVLGILYVILFDTPPPPSASGPVADPSPAHQGFVPPTLTTTATSVGPLLAAPALRTVTSEERERYCEEARRYAAAPIPGDLAELESLFREISTLENTLSENAIFLEPLLARSLSDKLGEVKRYYIFQRATRSLDEVVNHYTIPSTSEKERLASDLARMRGLRADIDWLESTASYSFPVESKDYLRQLIEVLDGMTRI